MLICYWLFASALLHALANPRQCLIVTTLTITIIYSQQNTLWIFHSKQITLHYIHYITNLPKKESGIGAEIRKILEVPSNTGNAKKGKSQAVTSERLVSYRIRWCPILTVSLRQCGKKRSRKSDRQGHICGFDDGVISILVA